MARLAWRLIQICHVHTLGEVYRTMALDIRNLFASPRPQKSGHYIICGTATRKHYTLRMRVVRAHILALLLPQERWQFGERTAQSSFLIIPIHTDDNFGEESHQTNHTRTGNVPQPIGTPQPREYPVDVVRDVWLLHRGPVWRWCRWL